MDFFFSRQKSVYILYIAILTLLASHIQCCTCAIFNFNWTSFKNSNPGETKTVLYCIWMLSLSSSFVLYIPFQFHYFLNVRFSSSVYRHTYESKAKKLKNLYITAKHLCKCKKFSFFQLFLRIFFSLNFSKMEKNNAIKNYIFERKKNYIN